MSSSGKFEYWKKPRDKYFVLIGTIFLFIALLIEIKDFLTISDLAIRTKIFSEAGWQEYKNSQYFGFAIQEFVISVFLGAFVIGHIAKSKKTARLYESILLAILSVVWIVCFIINLPFGEIEMTFSIILFAATVCGSIYTFYVSKKL